MKIIVINGTEVKGCTFQMKEAFLEEFRASNDITEYYLPKDLPHFCTGCKTCFLKDEHLCPHGEFVMPIWSSILEADLIVFAYPVYGLRAPGQVKSLLDHLCCHWIVHRPEREMFTKRAIIITNSIGASNKAAQKDVKTSLNWLGVSSVECLGAGLMEGAVWNQLSQKRRDFLIKKVKSLASKYTKYSKEFKPASKNIKISLIFKIAKMIQKGILKGEDKPTVDNAHWIKNGWIEAK